MVVDILRVNNTESDQDSGKEPYLEEPAEFENIFSSGEDYDN